MVDTIWPIIVKHNSEKKDVVSGMCRHDLTYHWNHIHEKKNVVSCSNFHKQLLPTMTEDNVEQPLSKPWIDTGVGA